MKSDWHAKNEAACALTSTPLWDVRQREALFTRWQELPVDASRLVFAEVFGTYCQPAQTPTNEATFFERCERAIRRHKATR